MVQTQSEQTDGQGDSCILVTPPPQLCWGGKLGGGGGASGAGIELVKGKGPVFDADPLLFGSGIKLELT